MKLCGHSVVCPCLRGAQWGVITCKQSCRTGRGNGSFNYFLTTCLLILWCLVLFGLIRFLIDGFRQETNRKLMERIKDALVHGQYSLTQECDYNLWVVVFKHGCRAFCLSERGKYPIWLKKKSDLIWVRVLGLTWPWVSLKRHRKNNNNY